MSEIVDKAVEAAQSSELAFCKFITPNDTGSTGGHQAGYHIHKQAWKLFFDQPGEKGANKDIFVTIQWQDDFETASRFIYYGVGTRNEYRLTRFGRGFPFLQEDCNGDLLIICKFSVEFFKGFVLSSDQEIEDFFARMNISANETNSIIPKPGQLAPDSILQECFSKYISSVKVDFPPTIDIANIARNCYNQAFNISATKARSNPDKVILSWLDSEFNLFKLFEQDRYAERIKTPFGTVDELMVVSNMILNRRKSRAGKSLEHHLSEVFDIFNLRFESQAKTEQNKKPDFLFPSTDAYFDSKFDTRKLFLLAAKTTCKDRWRQVISEGDRVKFKHLFTLQQGISENQLREMNSAGILLVVPKSNRNTFPEKYRQNILSLQDFLDQVSLAQN